MKYILLGSRVSSQSMKNYNTGLRKGTAMDHYRKISSEIQSDSADIINRLRREAAERANDLASEMSDGFVSPIDPEFYASSGGDEPVFSADRPRKRSQNLSRVEEYQRPSLTQRSLSRESYESMDPTDRITAGSSGSGLTSSGSRSNPNRHVTRRSISRELYDFNPTWAPSSSTTLDFGRSSRERSLGRDPINFDSLNDLEKRINNRRSESLSRPSLASQGRSLTQSELGSGSRRYSSGLRSPITVQEHESGSGLPELRNSGSGSGSSYGQPRYSSTLDDKSRTDWRRVSVPERGKDFKSLSKKYNR